MREQTINILAQLLHDNLGSKLTPALATGVLTLLNQEMERIEADKRANTTDAGQTPSS
jgi:hypothetical protein